MLDTSQIILLSSLAVLLILGMIGKVVKNKEKHRVYKPESISENDVLSDEEKIIKNYILNYKNSYSKEAIASALTNNGIEKEKAEVLVDKYY